VVAAEFGRLAKIRCCEKIWLKPPLPRPNIFTEAQSVKTRQHPEASAGWSQRAARKDRLQVDGLFQLLLKVLSHFSMGCLDDR